MLSKILQEEVEEEEEEEEEEGELQYPRTMRVNFKSYILKNDCYLLFSIIIELLCSLLLW